MGVIEVGMKEVKGDLEDGEEGEKGEYISGDGSDNEEDE